MGIGSPPHPHPDPHPSPTFLSPSRFIAPGELHFDCVSRASTGTPARSGLLIKVALLVTPTLLRGVVADALTSLPEVQVDEPERLPARSDAQYDVIVLSLTERDEEAEGYRTLAQFPTSRIIALRSDASRAFLYEMRPHRTPLGELSPQTLRDAIRGRIDTSGGTG